MFVITRKIGEKLVVDGNIEITVLNATDKRCSIGIEAPKEVTVFRKEVLERIKQKEQTEQTEQMQQ